MIYDTLKPPQHYRHRDMNLETLAALAELRSKLMAYNAHPEYDAWQKAGHVK